MEIELTTSNLRNLCRFCLNEGNYNILEHKFCWSKNDADNALEIEGRYTNAEEITVRDALKIYDSWQKNILALDTELQLICKVCLTELLSCYRFYKLLCASNKRIQKLYHESLRQNSTTEEAEEQIYETLEAEEISNEIKSSPTVTPERIGNLHTVTVPRVIQQQTNTHKRNIGKSAKFVLTDGVSQLLANVVNLPIATEMSAKRKTVFVENSIKRQRTSDAVPSQLQYETTTKCSSAPIEAIQDAMIVLDNSISQQHIIDIASPPPEYEATVEYSCSSESLIETVAVHDNSEELEDKTFTESQPPEYETTFECSDPNETIQAVINLQKLQSTTDLSPPPQHAATNRREGILDVLTVDYLDSLEEQTTTSPAHYTDAISFGKAIVTSVESIAVQTPKVISLSVDDEEVLPYCKPSSDGAGQTIYGCKYCPSAFTAPCFLKAHALKAHVCQHCMKAFIKTKDLFAHIKSAHQQHECKVCNKEFSSKSNMRAHAKRVHNEIR